MSRSFENNEFFRQLPDEMKQKTKGFKTEKEATDTLRQELIQIPDETIETVAGGRDRDSYSPRTKK